MGALSNVRNALLPAFAAVGGMVAPGAAPLRVQCAARPTQPGFGIPMATDIAFALGVIALLGARVPPALKVFIVAFAIIDDLGAIVLIATVYTAELSFTWLALALGIWAALIVLDRPLRVMALAPYLIGRRVHVVLRVQRRRPRIDRRRDAGVRHSVLGRAARLRNRRRTGSSGGCTSRWRI